MYKRCIHDFKECSPRVTKNTYYFSSPRTSECSPRSAETDEEPSHKQSTDNLVSKLPTYKASSSPSKIPTPSKSKLAKVK